MVGGVLWSVAGLLVLLLEPESGFTRTPDNAHLATSLLVVTFGLWAFWRHGGRRITAMGLWCMSSAVFVGFAGFWWWAQPGPVPDIVRLATTVGYWTTLAIFTLFGRRRYDADALPLAPVSPEATRWGITFGLWVTLLSIGLSAAGLRLGSTALSEVSFVGLVILTTSLVLHRPERLHLARRLVVIGVVVGLYAVTVFSGYGRLILVTLAIAPVILLSSLVRGRQVKALIIAGVAPAMMLMSRMREEFGRENYGQAFSGIGSVVEPMRDFGRLVSEFTSTTPPAHGYGETFFASAVVFVPRALWEDKPVGFGTTLTEIFNPALLAVGHSFASLSLGEWFYNFGWLGIVAMIPAIGVFLRLVDSGLARRMLTPTDSRRALLWLVLWCILAADVADLFWGGTHSYVSRTGIRAAAVLGLIFLVSRKRMGDEEASKVRLRSTAGSGRRTSRQGRW